MPIRELTSEEAKGLVPPTDFSGVGGVREATPEEVKGLEPPTQFEDPFDEDIDEDPGVPNAGPPSSLQPSPREIAEQQEGGFTGTLRQGLRIGQMDVDRRSPLQIAAEDDDVEMGPGVPASARALEGFAVDDKNVRLALKMGLERAFGKEIDVRWGAKTQRLEWKNPDTGKWTLANPPGLDAGDMMAFAGEGVVLGSEVAGGITGSLGGPATTVAGIGLGAFAGELMRLKMGQARGLNADLDNDDLIAEAAIRAGISMAGGVAGEAVFRVGRILLSTGGKTLPSALGKRADAISSGLDDLAEVSAKVQAKTGKKLPATPGQVVDDPLVESTEAQLVRRSEGQGIRDTYKAQQQVLKEFEEEVKSPFVGPRRDETLEVIGRDIQAVARRGPQKGAAVVEGQTAAAKQAVDDSLEIATRGELPPDLANTLARQGLQEGRDMVQSYFSRHYARINEMAGGARINLEPFRQVAKKWKKVIDDDILPVLVEEDGLLLRAAAGAKIKEVEGLEFGALVEGGRILEPVTKLVAEPASFGSVQRTLSALRREIRAAKKGVGARTDVKALSEIRDALVISRDRALRGRPELARQIDDLEAAYARARQLVDRSLVGDILKKKEGGGYVLRDEFVLNRILTSPSGAAQVARVLKDPQYAAFQDALEPIRAGILGKFKNEVYDRDTGLIRAGVLKTWMKNKRDSLKHFFDEDEIKRLDDVGDAAVMLRSMEQREKNILTKLNKSFGMKLNNYDSENVVETVFTPKRRGDVTRLKKILGADSREWAGFQGASQRQMWNDISSWSSGESAFKVNVGKLAGKLGNEGDRKLIETTFGKQYLNDLDTLTDAMKIAEKRPITTISDYLNEMTGKGDASALRHLARAYVGMFTMRGRVMTAAIKVRGKAAERALLSAFADAETMRRLVGLSKVSPNSASARLILGSMGATILTSPPAADEIEP